MGLSSSSSSSSSTTARKILHQSEQETWISCRRKMSKSKVIALDLTLAKFLSGVIYLIVELCKRIVSSEERSSLWGGLSSRWDQAFQEMLDWQEVSSFSTSSLTDTSCHIKARRGFLLTSSQVEQTWSRYSLNVRV